MSGVVAVGVAASRALSTFVAGKLLLVSFGPLAFSAHAQLVQLVAMALPAGCGFLSLAVSSAWAAHRQDVVRRARRTGMVIGLGFAALPLLAIALRGDSDIASWLFGDPGWRLALWLLPAGVLAAAATSYHGALLVGAGRGRDAALVEVAMAITGLTVAAMAAWTHQLAWVMSLPVAVLGSGAFVSTWLWRHAKARLERPAEAPAGAPMPLRSYLLTGLAASALAPAVMLVLRAEVLSSAGAGEVAGFVGAQRLAALVTAPVPVYIYMFLTSYFAASTRDEGSARVRALQWRIAAVLALSFVVVGCLLPWIVPLAFSAGFEVPLGVFLLVSAGEGLRAVAAVQAQYVATRGNWKQYLAADGVYFTVLVGAFSLSRLDAITLSVSYALAAASYLFALVLMRHRTASDPR